MAGHADASVEPGGSPPEDIPVILLVEDNPGDVRLITEAIKEIGAAIVIRTAADGIEALDFLRRKGPYAGEQRPDLILLDLSLPRKGGREVLSDIKTDPNLKQIPVVVFTASDAEDDITRCYDLQANSYIRKPADLERFITVTRLIHTYWLDIAKLPGPRDLT
jgi:chemotaxis family two-component system response regulator Rcp1